jgi:hypothetical protein
MESKEDTLRKIKDPFVAFQLGVKRLLFLIFLSISAFCSCQTPAENQPVDSRTEILWNSTVRIYLQDNLWTERDMYDAGHVLMVPLHTAFRMDVPQWREQISHHFAEFMAKDTMSFLSEPQALDLAREHYLYLASRFAVLATESGNAELVPSGLVAKLYDEVSALWQQKTAWWYEQNFPGGVRERLAWKMAQDSTIPSYYRAITDHERFLFAIAADLRSLELITGTRHLLSPMVREIMDVAYAVYNRYVVQYTDNTWLFQPGVWRDHRDYLYAGNDNLAANLMPSPVDDIAEDTSHSHRFPVWLKSLRDASRDNGMRSRYYTDLLDGLSKRFFDIVLRAPDRYFPGYRVTNFMDGRNGVYRWQYETAGINNGYGPFQLSGILVVGWWGMLPDWRAHQMYCDMAGRFPLPEDVVRTYTGPNTTRERNPLVRWPDFFLNGFGELLVRLNCYYLW